jgi:hypothetical protein
MICSRCLKQETRALVDRAASSLGTVSGMVIRALRPNEDGRICRFCNRPLSAADPVGVDSTGIAHLSCAQLSIALRGAELTQK